LFFFLPEVGLLKFCYSPDESDWVNKDIPSLLPIVWQFSNHLRNSIVYQKHLHQAEIKSASAQNYQILFEQNPHPMLIYSPAREKILAANDTMVNYYGYSKQELLQMSLLDLKPDLPNLTIHFSKDSYELILLFM
jgi:PAS domain-containing protein